MLCSLGKAAPHRADTVYYEGAECLRSLSIENQGELMHILLDVVTDRNSFFMSSTATRSTPSVPA